MANKGSYKPAHMHRLTIDCCEYSEIRPGLNTGWENSFLATFKSSYFFSIHTAKIDVVPLALSQLIQGMGNRSECTAGYFNFTNSFKCSNSPFLKGIFKSPYTQYYMYFVAITYVNMISVPYSAPKRRVFSG